MLTRRSVLSLALAVLLGCFGAAGASAQKYGGVLNAVQRDNPVNLSLLENTSSNTTWAMSPVYNNLVYYDPFQGRETLDTVIPELAESWRWEGANKIIVFKLHQNVRWHDGKPFTSRDVKHTWDVLRDVGGKKLKLNPRKSWWRNIREIDTKGDYEVEFKLEHPQPSLLALLASGFSIVAPAHVPPGELRSRTNGTGPFRLAEYKRDESVRVLKNQDYWVKGRPYLDGVYFPVIRSRGTRNAALIAGQVDTSFPGETPESVYQTIKERAPNLVVFKNLLNSFQRIDINGRKAPFNDLRFRQALSLAVDREAYVKGVYQGAEVSGTLMPPPSGYWGLTGRDLRDVVGYGDPAQGKAKSREMLKALGYGPDKPLQVTVVTRNEPHYVDTATWLLGQLKEVGIDAALKKLELAVWTGVLVRREYDIALNSGGTSVDDPDAAFYELYKCGSPRNVTGYCHEQFDKLIDEQSQLFDKEQRLALVHQIDRGLMEDVARVVLGFRNDYFTIQPYVKNLVAHQTHYSYARMQNVWLDK
ncbi:MAG: ABC transporter substrate-binding protein [Candidatus Lambdaproteobacteria bacterium]|nr:ABC transporter substrate-binding protein [Candidatus Lambdaproteobacteria bacterium]